MSTTTIERTRCAHDLDAATCAYCAFPALVVESESARTTRTAARLASSMRRLLADRDRERDTMRGYALMTASMVAAIESSARAAARPFGADDAEVYERTLDAFALWLARQDAATVEGIRGDTGHVRGLARRIARRLARAAGTGRGHMPRLVIGEHAGECESGQCVPYCGAVMLDNALRGLVVRAIGADGIAHDRPPTRIEREAIADTLDYERVEGMPNYPRWLDAFGESAPNVGAAHPFGHRAPGVPERDAPSLRGASMVAAARALGLNARLVDAALSNVRRTRRGYAVDTRAVAAAIGDTRHVSNVRRDLLAAVAAVEGIERDDIGLPIPAAVMAQARPVMARHRCQSSKCAARHGIPIIESTYRGGIQLRADIESVFPVEHDHVRERIERADSGELIESTYTYGPDQCHLCRSWRERIERTYRGAVTMR